MGKCVNHPDRETNFMCMKHNKYLCEECLKCQDPNIHCKFRSSCPVWFMEKRNGKGIDEVPVSKTKEFTVVFQPDNKEVRIPEGATLLYAAQLGDVPLTHPATARGPAANAS